LYDAQSDIHRELQTAIDFAYVMDRLQLTHAPQLSKGLSDTLRASGNSEALLLEAKMVRLRSPGPRTDQALLAALESDPGNRAATYMLLRNRADDVLSGALPERIRPYADNLTGLTYAVIESMYFAQRRDLSRARENDELLASATSNEQWYLDAAKLRADWRITAARLGESAEHAKAALDIIDEVIALRQDINFYGMRMAAAFLSDDYDAVVETARRMVWLVRQEFEFRFASPARKMSARELSNHLLRLESMQAGLSEVRMSGRVADYKFLTLDESISELREKIEAYAAR
jgi:hypothetical protein